MSSVIKLLTHPVGFEGQTAPVWFWIVWLVVIPFVNELVQRSKRTEAQSLWQLFVGLFKRKAKEKGLPVEKVPPAAVLLVVGALALGGCGDPMVTYYRTTSSTAVATSTAYRTLSQVDKAKLSKITEVAKAGAPGEAQRLLDEWLPKYAKARKGLDAVSATVEGAMAAAPVVELAIDKKKQAMTWIARLVALAAEVTRILTEAGALGEVL